LPSTERPRLQQKAYYGEVLRLSESNDALIDALNDALIDALAVRAT